MSWSVRLHEAFSGGPRLATTLLAAAGAGIAAWSAVRSIAISHPLQAAVYTLVCAGLLSVAVAILLSRRVAAVISAVVLFASGPAAIAAAAELAVGMDRAKAEEVRALGVQPRTALELNLAYFLAGTAIAGWLLARLLRRPKG